MGTTPSGRRAAAAVALLLGTAAAVAPSGPHGAGAAAEAITVPTQATGAADQGHGHGAHGRQQPGGYGAVDAEAEAVVRAFQEANARMHAAMSEPGTGDADRDFARGMIAHHEGAIEMAEILLRYGRDPDLRTLAEEIIEVQRREIGFLLRWLAEHPG